MTLSYEDARDLLGVDFITPEEIAAARGVKYGKRRSGFFRNAMPPRETLEACLAQWGDGAALLVPGPPKPMSLLDVRELNPDYFYDKTHGWYAKHGEQIFAIRDVALPAWLMLRKGPVPGSMGHGRDAQLKLLTPSEERPNIGGFTWGVTTYAAVRGIRLFGSTYARTSSVSMDGSVVGAGGFDKGLHIWDWGNGQAYPHLGLATSWKLG